MQYACPCCSKIMKSRAHVKRHILVHTGARPYACKICGGTFNQTDSLKAHMKNVHKIPVSNLWNQFIIQDQFWKIYFYNGIDLYINLQNYKIVE